MGSLQNCYLFRLDIILTLLALTCSYTVATAEIPTCRQSLAAHSSMIAPTAEPKLSDQHLAKGIAAYLHFLDVLLMEIGSGEGESLERKLQLLNFIVQSATPIQSLDMFSAERSRLLTLFRNSDVLEKLALNISLEQWKQIQRLAMEKRSELLRITELHEEKAVEGEPDFIDLPDVNGQVSLHHLLETRQYEKAIALLNNPKTTTRYINTRDNNDNTPLDFFELKSIFSSVIENLSPREKILMNDYGGELAVKVAEMLIEKSAMTGLQMRHIEWDFFKNPTNRPNQDLNDWILDFETFADQAWLNLTWLYEIGGSLDALSVRRERLAESFVLTGHLDGLKLLKSLGADLKYRNDHGETLLHHAATHDRQKVISYLVEIGLDINAPDNSGMTPIFKVIKNSDIQTTIKLFADLGANLNHAAVEGMTPAHRFTRFDLSGHLRALALNGADLERRNQAGLTPLEYYKKNKHSTLAVFAKYFISKGITPESRGIYKTNSRRPTYFKKGDSEE